MTLQKDLSAFLPVCQFEFNILVPVLRCEVFKLFFSIWLFYFKMSLTNFFYQVPYIHYIMLQE